MPPAAARPAPRPPSHLQHASWDHLLCSQPQHVGEVLQRLRQRAQQQRGGVEDIKRCLQQAFNTDVPKWLALCRPSYSPKGATRAQKHTLHRCNSSSSALSTQTPGRYLRYPQSPRTDCLDRHLSHLKDSGQIRPPRAGTSTLLLSSSMPKERRCISFKTSEVPSAAYLLLERLPHLLVLAHVREQRIAAGHGLGAQPAASKGM